MIKLSEILAVFKATEVDEFIKKYSRLTLNEPGLKEKDIKLSWRFLGDNPSNGSAVNILGNGEKGLVERVTNAIDAVIEKQVQRMGTVAPSSSASVIKFAFPKYYENVVKVKKGESTHSYSFDCQDQVILAVHDSSRSTRPTFDIVDKGTGIIGSEFPNTILSLNHGNKLSREKQYLIGAFGQGGSTSLPFTYATIIVSKYKERFYWTVIKQVDLADYKNSCFVYLQIDNSIPEAENDVSEHEGYDEYIIDFCNHESGTLVRMVETEISKEYRDNEITKPRTLSDYINTQLFDVGIPVNLIDCRKNFAANAHAQDRNAYGTFMKLKTWKKYVHDEYSGTMEIVINNQTYGVDYYVILPAKEEDWGSDKKAEDTMRQFNVTGDPVIYTVNGQTITTESFTKLKNAGLNFLRNRLLVIVNLDVLGMEKYKFFTSDRARIKDTEKTHGFFDKIVQQLAKVEKLIEINGIIGDKAIASNVDTDLINEISDEVRGEYNKFLKGGAAIKGRGHRPQPGPLDEDYADHIVSLDINLGNSKFYIDQEINLILKTGAIKHINQSSQIYMFVDGKSFYSFTPSYMNGRIQYTFAANSSGFGKGVHQIRFQLYDACSGQFSMESNTVAIEVLNEKAPKTDRERQDKVLNLTINLLAEQELICDIVKNDNEKSIQANICLEGDMITAEVYGYAASPEYIKELQSKLIKPIVLFALYQAEQYDNIPNSDQKNRLIVSLIRSLMSSGIVE